MPGDYLSLPLRLDLITRRPNNKPSTAEVRAMTCALEESIQYHVYLIITTRFGEARYDPDFGSAIWEDDFSGGNDSNDTRWTDEIQNSIRDGVRKYEKRLERVTVEAQINREGGTDAHKRLIIVVSGEISRSNHRLFRFEREILIAPFVVEK